VTALLGDRHVGFAVVGAAAMAVHGVARSTQDVDLLTVDTTCLDTAMWQALAADRVDVSARRGDPDDPLAGVVRLRAADGSPIDVIVGRSPWQHSVVERATPAVIEGCRVPVARPADLILLKLYAGGPLDAWDIEQLLAGADRAALVAAVDASVGALPEDARRLWSRLRG
jgi:hypothetical protein